MPENSFPAEIGVSGGGEPLGQTVQYLQGLQIVQPSLAPEIGSQPVSTGIEAIHRLLLANKVSLEKAMKESPGLQVCIVNYVATYFRNFLLRWPILHAPTFDVRTASLPLAASVCVLGAWFQSSEGSTERFYALRVHEILLQRLLHDLVHTPPTPLKTIH